jgi:transposase-like protein
MKTSNGSFLRRRAPRIDATRRAQLLAAFDRSGLSVAAFARQQGIHPTTLYGWRQRQGRGKTSPAFVQVELSPPAAPAELMIELGAAARLRLVSAAQVPLAARLLQAFNDSRSC